MSDEDSLFGGSSPSPQSPERITDQSQTFDASPAVNITVISPTSASDSSANSSKFDVIEKVESPPSSPHHSTTSSNEHNPKVDVVGRVESNPSSPHDSAISLEDHGSLESEMMDDLFDETSQKNDGETLDEATAKLPSPPRDRSLSEDLPTEVTILTGDPSSSDQETEPEPTKIHVEEASKIHEAFDNIPEVEEERIYAAVDADPEVEVEIFDGLTPDEHAAEAARSKLVEEEKDIYPINNQREIIPPTPPTPAPPLPPTPPTKPPHEADPDYGPKQFDTEEDSDTPTSQPTSGLERPVQKPGLPKSFTIVRLIEHTDKRGNNLPSAIRLRTHYFDVDFGDFLLDVSGSRSEIAQVRNYAGQERYVPRRMLQSVYQPWDIPAKMKMMGKGENSGVPLPLVFMNRDVGKEESQGNAGFEEEEPVMVMRRTNEGEGQLLVTDWERKAGSLSLEQVDRRYDVPWGILVDEEALMVAWGKSAAPKLPKKATGKGTKRKRKGFESDTDGGDLAEEEYPGKKLAGKKPVKDKVKIGKGKKVLSQQEAEIVSDSIADDEAIEAPAPARRKSTSKKTPAAKRPAKKLKLDLSERGSSDDDSEPTEVMRGEKPAGKSPAKKTTASKKVPAGKKPAKKTVRTKKTAKAALMEAVIEEEESGKDDMV